MKVISIALAVSAALASGAALAQEKAAAEKSATAAKSTQVAQQGSGLTTAGSAAAGQTGTAAGAVQGFGNAVVTALPHIGITAGFTAVGQAASDQGGAAVQH